MKNIYPPRRVAFVTLMLFLPILSLAQIYSTRSTSQSILVAPDGIQSKYSTPPNINNVALGEDALAGNRTCDSTVAIGRYTLSSTHSTHSNVGVGLEVLRNNVTGSRNVAIGRGAMINSTSGSYDIALGEFSLRSDINARRNIAIGSESLSNISFDNSGIPYDAHNIAIGNYALLLCNPTSGNVAQKNIAIGDSALLYTTNADRNVAIGLRALYANTTGYFNFAIGNNALSSNQTSYQSIAIGDSTLMKHITNGADVAIGMQAMANDIASNSNVAIGYQAMFLKSGISSNVAIGPQALYASDNSPTTDHVSYNVAVGQEALYHCSFLTTVKGSRGYGNTAVGIAAGKNVVNEFTDTFLGDSTDINNINAITIFNATALGHGAKVDAPNKVVIGNTNVTNIGGYAVWTNYSDRRLKKHINYSEKLGLNFINRLQPVTYFYKKDAKKRSQDGLIAQDMQTVLKNLNLHFSGLVTDENDDKTLSISYEQLVIPLINAVRERQFNLEKLQRMNAKRQVEIVQLKEILSKLENRNNEQLSKNN